MKALPISGKPYVYQTFLLLFLALIMLQAGCISRAPAPQDPDQVEEAEDNPRERAEWFHRERTLPNDSLALPTYSRELNKAIQKMEKPLLATPEGPLRQLEWRSLGPHSIVLASTGKTFSGRIRGVAVHPQDPNTVYIGAASGGLWKTTDGGVTWTSLNADFVSNTFGAIAIDPNDPEVVYAGTGEAAYFWTSNHYDGRGVFKSTDGGNSWEHITHGFGEMTHFSSICVSPHDSRVIFAAMAGGYRYTKGLVDNLGIWKSKDKGATWKRTLALDNVAGNGAYDVLIHPTEPDSVYAAVAGEDDISGFYISSDGGDTWRKSNEGLPASILRMQIAVSKDIPSRIYSLVYNRLENPFRTKAFRSDNGGASWQQISEGHNFGRPTSDQGWYDLCISVDPSDADNVYAGNVRISRATDGMNFDHLSNPDMHSDYHQIVFAPSNHDHIYVGCDGGIFRSIDGGASWVSRNSKLSTLQLYGVASHPTEKNTLIAGSQDNGGFITTDYGQTPWPINGGGDITGVFYNPLDPSIAYRVSKHHTLSKSTDGGRRFRQRIDIDPNSTFFNIEKNFLIHPTNHQYLYAASSTRLWKSTDGGDSWGLVSNEDITEWITTIDQSPANPDILILAGRFRVNSNPDIMISRNEGVDWSKVTTFDFENPRWISRVYAHPTQEGTVFVVRTGYGSGKIYRSISLGNSWEDITSDLPDIPHSDIFIDPLNASNYYVANDFGVYASFDAGESWQHLGNGLPIVPATQLDYFQQEEDRFLRVATYGRGVFELDLNQRPVPPSDLQARLIPGQQLHVSWQDNSIFETGFELWHAVLPQIHPTQWEKDTLAPNTTSVQIDIDPFVLGQEHIFKVRALNPKYQSAFSNEERVRVMHLIPSVSLTYPNGGETFEAGSEVEVNWQWPGIPKPIRVTVNLSTDGGSTWQALHETPDVPNRPPLKVRLPVVHSDRCLVKVESGAYYDLSDQAFSVIAYSED